MSSLDNHITQIEQIFGHNFANKLFCAKALQMKAPLAWMSINGTVFVVQKNVNLAIRGDTILDTVLCQIWDERRNHRGNGFREGQYPV